MYIQLNYEVVCGLFFLLSWSASCYTLSSYNLRGMHRSAEPSPLHAYLEYGSQCILLCMFKIDQEYHELHTLHLNRVLVLLILITTYPVPKQGSGTRVRVE